MPRRDPWYAAFLPRREAREFVTVRIYTRAECPLCDEAKAAIGRARVGRRFRVEEVDVGRDAELEREYGASVPVVTVEGRIACKGRVTSEDFRRRFLAIVTSTPPSAPAS